MPTGPDIAPNGIAGRELVEASASPTAFVIASSSADAEEVSRPMEPSQWHRPFGEVVLDVGFQPMYDGRVRDLGVFEHRSETDDLPLRLRACLAI